MSSNNSADRDLRAARRVVLLFAASLAAVVAGVVMVLLGARGDEGPPVLDPVDPSEDPSGGSDSQVVTEAIGPAPGEDLASYVEAREAVLGAVEGRYVAVVSLTGYSTPETVEDLMGDLDLDSYLVAFVGDEPRRTSDIDETRDEIVEDAEAQLAEIEGLVPTVEDPEFVEFYRAEIERYRAVLDEPDRDDVVFGLVVHGPASELRALAARASVRLVDVGVSDRLSDGAVVTGLRPEERSVAGEPAFRP